VKRTACHAGGAADALLTRLFRDAGFDLKEARDRAQIAAATMHSITRRARAGAPKAELQQVGDAALTLLSRWNEIRPSILSSGRPPGFCDREPVEHLV
jgi:hypothetical protein